MRVPDELARRARDIAAGLITPVPARDAATVVLLRETAPSGDRMPASRTAEIEVYLLKRQATMAFAAGAHVFPGGSVDPRDTDHAVAWAGPSPAAWAAVLGSDEATARGLVCAAVRETFEESGVLLAGPSPDAVVPDTTGWEAERAALIDRSLSFAEFLASHGLVLRSDLLKAWAHWITPEVETRRFDTRFFVAVLPRGQRTRDVGGEASLVTWMTPRAALDARDVFLMPPTHVTLTEIADFESIDAVFAADRKIVPHLPRVVDGELRL